MSQKLKMAEDSRAWKQGVAGVCPALGSPELCSSMEELQRVNFGRVSVCAGTDKHSN